MAREVNQVVRDTLGNYNIQVIELSAKLEAAQEEIARLKAKYEPEDAPKKTTKKQKELNGGSDTSSAV